MSENAYLRGRYQEGIELAAQALELAKSTYGPEHPAVAECMNTLAHFYRALGWYVAAEPFHRKAMKINERVHGKPSRQLGRDFCNLCTLFLITGRYAKASQACQEAVGVFTACEKGGCPYPSERFTFKNEWRMFEECSGPDRCALGIAFHNLAQIAGEQGRFSDAIKHLDRAVELLGNRHICRGWALAVAKGGLAEIYMLMGREAEACEFKAQAMELADRTAGLDEPAVVFMLIRVVAAFSAKAKDKEIQKESERLMNLLTQKVTGDDVFRLARYLDEIVRIYKIRNLLPEAGKLLKDLLAFGSSSVGHRHRNMPILMEDLANVYKAQGRHIEAEAFLHEAHNIRDTSPP